MNVMPDRGSFNNLFDGLPRLLPACCAILFFSACADGYPTEDELNITPLEMSQAQRLEAMNQLGQEAHPELTWLYHAMPGCSLQWTMHGADAGKERFDLPLRGAGIDLRFNKADQLYGVQVRPADAPELNEQTVLLSKKWVDAIEMSQLVRWFQISCGAGNAAAGPSNPNPL